jgi:3-polyprenyl-4-hydroxybenzoate decarboxylase
MSYPYKSLRDWLLEEENLGTVVRITAPIKCGDYSSIVDIGNSIPGKQPKTEVRALARYLHSLPDKPAGILENPVYNRPDVPVVVNPWPSRERVLRGMGLRAKDELCRKIKALSTTRVKPLIVSGKKSPCKEVIIPEDRLDLRKDLPRVWVEFQQSLWSTFNATLVLRDPETSCHSLGKIRLGQYEWRDANPATPYPEELVQSHMVAALQLAGPRMSNTGRFYQKHRAAGKPMPGVFIFGDPADIEMLAPVKTIPWPESGDEYEMLGGLRGEPVDLVESETVPGLMIPAHTEWVIEGEFLLQQEKMPAYAGEDNFIGFVLGDMPYTIFRVRCITCRRDALWAGNLSSVGGLHGNEGTHSALALLNLEVEALNYLRGLGFLVQDVVLLAGPFMTVIQLTVDGKAKPHSHYGQEVGAALSSYGVHVASPYIIVVGPDIDPHDAAQVAWTIAMRSAPLSDTTAVRKDFPGIDAMLGFRSGDRGTAPRAEQVVIDATTPVPERYDGWRPRTEPPDWEREAIERIREKLEPR